MSLETQYEILYHHSMKTKLELNDQLKVHNTMYRVIGLDTYTLKNVLDTTKKWVSYTLIDDEKKKTWISFGIAGEYFTQWETLSGKQFKKDVQHASPNLDLTGIATISFQGNQGYSTPLAEIVWFNTKNLPYEFLAIERFLQQEKEKVKPMESYYQTGTILKDFMI